MKRTLLDRLHGRRKISLSAKDIRCCDDLLVSDDFKSIEAEYELWFDVDSYFGTKTRNTSAIINFYTVWHDDGRVDAEVVIDDLPNSYKVRKWKLTTEEQTFFTNLMEDYSDLLYSIGLSDLLEQSRLDANIEEVGYELQAAV